MFASMLLFSLLNLRITKNAVNIGTYSLEFPVVIFEIMVCVILGILLNGKLGLSQILCKVQTAIKQEQF